MASIQIPKLDLDTAVRGKNEIAVDVFSRDGIAMPFVDSAGLNVGCRKSANVKLDGNLLVVCVGNDERRPSAVYRGAREDIFVRAFGMNRVAALAC